MERLKLIFLILSLVGIAFCLGVSVWLYLRGFGWIYMMLFFLAFLWQGRMLWSFLRQKK